MQQARATMPAGSQRPDWAPYAGDGSSCWCPLLIVPVGEELESSAEGGDVGADGVKLDVPEFC